MKKIWKVIPSHPKYEVCNEGKVRNRWTQKVMDPKPNKRGAMQVVLYYNQTPDTKMVARLVGELFCRGFKPELRASHKDGDKTNCSATNLKWVSQSKVTGIPFSKNQKQTTKKEEQP